MSNGNVAMPGLFSGSSTLGPTNLRASRRVRPIPKSASCAPRAPREDRRDVVAPHLPPGGRRRQRAAHPARPTCRPIGPAWAAKLQALHGTGVRAAGSQRLLRKHQSVAALHAGLFAGPSPDGTIAGGDVGEDSRLADVHGRPVARNRLEGEERPAALREIDPIEFAELREYLDRHPGAALETRLADEGGRFQNGADRRGSGSIESDVPGSPTLDYEIQVFRVGNAAFVSLPGEPFVEGQLAIKIASPTFPTLRRPLHDAIRRLPPRPATPTRAAATKCSSAKSAQGTRNGRGGGGRIVGAVFEEAGESRASVTCKSMAAGQWVRRRLAGRCSQGAGRSRARSIDRRALGHDGSFHLPAGSRGALSGISRMRTWSGRVRDSCIDSFR